MDTNTMSFTIAACILLYLSVIHLTVPAPIPGIPYKRRWRWAPAGHLAPLGAYWALSGESFSWFSQECIDLRSSIVQVFLPSFSWKRPTVILSNIPEIEEIVMRRLGEMDRASLIHDLLDFMMPKATFSMKTNEELKSQRRLWSILLSSGFLREVAAPKFHESISRLIDLWRLKSGANTQLPFEASDDLRFTALDAIWGTAMGSNLAMIQKEIQRIDPRGDNSPIIFENASQFFHSLEILLWTLNWTMTSVYPRLSQWVISRLPFFRNAQRTMDKILRSEITSARNLLGSERGDSTFGLREVLERQFGSAVKPQDEDNLKDELLQFLIFGHETTSAAVGWALKHLADNQGVQTRLRAALFDAFPTSSEKGMPDASIIVAADIPYLDAFIAEVLRLSFVGPVAFRETITDSEVLGFNIPAGTTILLVTGGPSHLIEPPIDQPNAASCAGPKKADKRWNAEAAPLHRFAPERWLRSDGSYNAIAGPSLPFSTGARGCFGRKIALMELKFMVTMLVLSFNFPRLYLSGYGSTDAQIRRPTTCYIRPLPLI